MKKIVSIIIVATCLILNACKKNDLNNEDDLSTSSVKKSATLPNIWGVGLDNRVYRYDGYNWYEPNPGAGLLQISAGHCGGVWGIGANARIFRYEGACWIEPNPSAGLYQISALSDNEAWGVGASCRVFRTINGGVNWIEQTIRLKEISVGSKYNIWGLTNDNKVYRLNGSTWDGTWVEVPNYRFRQISAGAKTNCAYGLGIDNTRVFRTDQDIWGGPLWFMEPNPACGLNQISAGDWGEAWGIGASNRIFRTTNFGLSWGEPNPSAGLAQISAGANQSY